MIEAIRRLAGENAGFTITDGVISSWSDQSKVRKPTEEEIIKECNMILEEEPMIYFREERDRRLSLTDWRMSPDYPNSDQELWVKYREDLRSLPQKMIDGQISKPIFDNNDTFIFNDWPSEPT